MDAAHANKRWRGALAAGMAAVFLMAAPVFAQWAKIRLPGTPRTSDGTPNLTAPVPKTPEGRPGESQERVPRLTLRISPLTESRSHSSRGPKRFTTHAGQIMDKGSRASVVCRTASRKRI